MKPNFTAVFAAFIALFTLSALVSFSGCALIEGPRQKLNKGAFQFNEGIRWGRYNDVLPIVDAEALEQFQKVHEGWGTRLQVSSAEILQIIYDENEKKAIISVQFTWYRKKEMVVYDTITNQNWEYRTGKWWMIAEEYVSGEPF